VKTGWSNSCLAEFSKEVYGSKRALLLLMIMMHTAHPKQNVTAFTEQRGNLSLSHTCREKYSDDEKNQSKEEILITFLAHSKLHNVFR
jgi:hypothetical protein